MSDWVFFLVRDIDPKLLKQMRRDAKRERLSLSDFMRSILCEHYELDCPSSRASTRLEKGARTQLLRMHRELWVKVKADAEESGESMQVLVHAALAARYVTAEEAIA